MKLEDIIESLSLQTAQLRQAMLNNTAQNVLPPPPEKSFDSIAVMQNKAVKEAETDLNFLLARLNDGIEAIFEVLKENPSAHEKIIAWFTSHSQSMLNFMQAEAEFSPHETLGHKLNFPDELLAHMHYAALELSKQQKYAKAAAAMLVCIVLEPKVFMFWFDYGTILQLSHADAEALYAFQAALIYKEENPSVYAHMAKSWADLDVPDEAKACLQTALHLCEGKTGYDEFRGYCYALYAHCNENMRKIC